MIKHKLVTWEIHIYGEGVEREYLQEKLGLKDRKNFRINYLNHAIEIGLVSLTIPDKPTSINQKYYLTEKGKAWIKKYN